MRLYSPGFRHSSWLCLAVIVLRLPTAFADARSVSLAESLGAANKAPEQIANVRRTEAAQAQVEAAGAWPSTNISLSTNLRTARVVPAVSFPLPVFGTLHAAEQQARAESTLAVEQAAVGSLDLRRRVRLAWLNLYRAERFTTLATQTAEQAKQLAEMSAHRFDAGDSPRAETVAANAEQRRAAAEATAMAASVAEASAVLAGVLGWPVEAPLHADGELPSVELPASPTWLLRRVQNHPQARAALAQVSASQARIDVANRERYPQLSLELEAAIDDPTLPGSDLRAGVGLTLPLLGRGSEKEHAARSEKLTAEAETAATQHALAAQLVAAYRRCSAALGRARTLRQDVLPAQREAARLAQIGYAEGQQRFSDVLQAERSRVEGERSALDAEVDLAIAIGDLEWALGGPL